MRLIKLKAPSLRTNLYKWIDQRSHGVSAARMSNESPPQFQAVNKLPVVDGEQGVLLVAASDGVPQVDGQLPDVDEGLVVGEAVVEAQELDEAAAHEGDGLEGRGGGELGVLHVGQVHRLYCRLQQFSAPHELIIMNGIKIYIWTTPKLLGIP